MAAAHPHALQDTFLEHVRKHDVPVTVFLASGIRLQGTVAGFDSYALLPFETGNPTHLQARHLNHRAQWAGSHGSGL